MTLLKAKNKENMPSVFSDLFDTDKFFNMEWPNREFGNKVPAVNVIENGKEFRVELAAPGFSKNDFKVSVENDVLSISAEKKEEKKEENERYTRKEFSYNSFTRSFSIPKSVNGDKVDAKYVDGVLKLSLPKKVEESSSAKKEVRVS